MRKFTALALAALLLLSMTAASAQTYEAKGLGFGGDVTVTMEIEDGAIKSVAVDAPGETEGIGSRAAEELPGRILEAQSAEVDAVAGATLTSNAILSAAADILAEVSGEGGAQGTFADGEYKATAAGFYGAYDVTVTVAGGVMTDIAIGENAETPTLGGKALELMKADMLKYNTAMVDVVSGATLTSVSLRNAVADCLRAANAPQAMLTAPAAPEKAQQEITTQVLVIGSGAAGFAAAISAKEAGADVLMIEKQGLIGGSTITSAGIVYAALSEEDVPGMVSYYMERAEGNANEEQLTFYAENSMNTIQWLTERGVEWMFTAPSGTAPEPRANFSMNVTGASLIGPLEARAKELGIEILLNVRATELITDENGAVTGAKAEGKDADYVFSADAVVLATGGFDASEELKAKYTPVASGDFPLSSKGNVGDGLLMAMAIGADTEFKNGSIGFVIVDGSLPASGMSGSAMGAPLYVAPDGGFLGLNVDYPISYAMIKNAGLDSCYGIYDAAGAQNGQSAIDAGFGYTADTLEALAEAAGMDAAKLTEAVGQSALGEAPYYAVVVKPSTIGSMGGLKTNTDAQIIRATGEAIPGLYGAGEVANGGFYYHEYPCSGSSISLSFTYGIEAGNNAAAYAKAK